MNPETARALVVDALLAEPKAIEQAYLRALAMRAPQATLESFRRRYARASAQAVANLQLAPADVSCVTGDLDLLMVWTPTIAEA